LAALFFRLWLNRRYWDGASTLINGYEGVVGFIAEAANVIGEGFRKDPKIDLHGGVESACDIRLYGYEFSYADSRAKAHIVHGGGYTHPLRMPISRYRRRNIHPIEELPSHEVAQSIGMVGENHLGKHGKGV
jgi:hypothetical protein